MSGLCLQTAQSAAECDPSDAADQPVVVLVPVCQAQSYASATAVATAIAAVQSGIAPHKLQTASKAAD